MKGISPNSFDPKLFVPGRTLLMLYMNEYDRTGAIYRFARASKPNRLGLAFMVDNLATWADNHSDGWAYWPKPARAAEKAMRLIESTTNAANEQQERVDITDAEMLAAARPIKAFCTRMVKAGTMTREDREMILRSVEVLP